MNLRWPSHVRSDAPPTQKRIAETFEQLWTEKSGEADAVNWLGLAMKRYPTHYPSHPCDKVYTR